MTPQECHLALTDLAALYGMGEAAKSAWNALVYKACSRMPVEQFRAVCGELLTEAGPHKPSNHDFWECFRRLSGERGWKQAGLCGNCGGSKVSSPCFLVRDGWRTADPFPELAGSAFTEGCKPCACDGSEGAKAWTASYHASASQGWQERTFQDYWSELRDWQAAKKARKAPGRS